jgi:hypothetical protein
VFFSSAPTQAFRPPDQLRWVVQRRRLRLRSPDSAQRMATVGHPRPGVPGELALRKPQGPFGVPTDLAVRGGASLGQCLVDFAVTGYQPLGVEALQAVVVLSVLFWSVA